MSILREFDDYIGQVTECPRDYGFGRGRRGEKGTKEWIWKK